MARFQSRDMGPVSAPAPTPTVEVPVAPPLELPVAPTPPEGPRFPKVSVPTAEPSRFKCLAVMLEVRDRTGRIVCRASLGEVKFIHPGTDLYAIALANPQQWEALDSPIRAKPSMARNFRPSTHE